jgi:hypothetical protein
MAKTKNKKQPNKIKSLLSSKQNIYILLIVIIAAFGAWRVFLSGASPNNCQPEKGVNICDIDQVQGNLDNVLSNGPEAQNLGKDTANWPLYFGAAFRAPTSALDGAQPVYRVYNGNATWHDYMLEAGKRDKEAKAPGQVTNEGIVFYAWPSASRPGLVPVYRLTQGGTGTKVIFTTDRAWRDKFVAADINNNVGWKDGGIPFYAFPPTYKAIAADGKPQANPNDCSIRENFVSDRCRDARNALNEAVANGNVAASNDCPATLEVYIKEPFPSRFPQACQDKWNKEQSNCSVRENFVSDRCRDARAAFEKAEAERIARENAERQAAIARQNNGGGNGRGNNGGGDNGGGNVDCSKQEYFYTDACSAQRRSIQALINIGNWSTSQQERARQRADAINDARQENAQAKGGCAVRYTYNNGWRQQKVGTKYWENMYKEQCTIEALSYIQLLKEYNACKNRWNFWTCDGGPAFRSNYANFERAWIRYK